MLPVLDRKTNKIAWEKEMESMEGRQRRLEKERERLWREEREHRRKRTGKEEKQGEREREII